MLIFRRDNSTRYSRYFCFNSTNRYNTNNSLQREQHYTDSFRRNSRNKLLLPVGHGFHNWLKPNNRGDIKHLHLYTYIFKYILG